MFNINSSIISIYSKYCYMCLYVHVFHHYNNPLISWQGCSSVNVDVNEFLLLHHYFTYLIL